MSPLANPLTFGALFATGLGVLLMATLVWRQRALTAHAVLLTLTLLSIAEILIAYSFSFSPMLDFDQHVLAIRATYVGWLIGPMALMLFVARITERDRWLRPWLIPILWGFPSIFAIVIFGPWAMDLFFGGGFNPETFAFPRTRPVYIAFYLWVYSMLSVSVVLTVVSAIKARRLHRYQVALVLIVILVPWILSSLSFLNIRFFGVGPAVLSLIPVSIAAFGIANFKAFDLRPLTREESAFGTQTGVVVLDLNGRVSAINSTAVWMLGPGRSPAMGLDVEEVWSHRPEIVAALRGVDIEGVAIESVEGQPLEFATVAMTAANGRETGTIIVIRPRDHAEAVHA